MFMIADTMGWRLEDVSETLEPVLARSRSNTEFFSVDKGYALGIKQSVAGSIGGRDVVKLELEMSVGAPDPHDGVEIDGTPPLKMRIDGGIQGDLATASILANCVPAIARSRMVGLLTMRDLPLLPYTRPRPQPREDFE